VSGLYKKTTIQQRGTAMTIQTKQFTTALCFVLAFVTTQMQAQQPKTPEALAGIMRLAGYWEGPADLIMEGKVFHVTYSADFKSTADGNGLYMDEWFSHPELGALKGANLIGYNANDGKIHWMSVDNFGTAHEHLGAWKSPDHFFMQANEKQKGKKFVESIDMTFKSDDLMEFHLVSTLGGKVTSEGKATFRRQPRQAMK
jgi:hypothetical protein